MEDPIPNLSAATQAASTNLSSISPQDVAENPDRGFKQIFQACDSLLQAGQLVFKIGEYRPNTSNAPEATKELWAVADKDGGDLLAQAVFQQNSITAVMAQFAGVIQQLHELANSCKPRPDGKFDRKTISERLGWLIESVKKFGQAVSMMNNKSNEDLVEKLTNGVAEVIRKEYPGPQSIELKWKAIKSCQATIEEAQKKLLTVYNDHFKKVAELREKQHKLKYLQLQRDAENAKAEHIKGRLAALDIQRQAIDAATEEERSRVLQEAAAQRESVSQAQKALREAHRLRIEGLRNLRDQLQVEQQNTFKKLEAELAAIK